MRVRAATLTLCFLAAGAVVYSGGVREIHTPVAPLRMALAQVSGWESRDGQLAGEVVAALNLDDYLVRTYRGENGTVDLYVGYYFGHEKVGAAHSPLVCFPGQGWEVSDTEPFVIPFGPDEAQKIHASAMTVRKGERSELVVYWFQAHERTSGDTFRQKVHTLYNRFSRKGEANAFVRVSVPVVEGDVAGARRTVFAFVQAFYPMFVRYVTST